MEEAIDAEASATRELVSGERGGPVTVVREGDKLYVPALRAEGTALSTPDKDGRVRVRIGGATAVLPIRELRTPPRSDESAPSRRGAATASAVPAVAGPDLGETGTEVDVRGFETDDAVRAVERFLEDASVGGLQTVRIIHGKGKGILREQMKRFLSGNQLVREFRLGEMGEGGTGVTIVFLEP
jgi:DNA mismatch repair protein MutS2